MTRVACGCCMTDLLNQESLRDQVFRLQDRLKPRSLGTFELSERMCILLAANRVTARYEEGPVSRN